MPDISFRPFAVLALCFLLVPLAPGCGGGGGGDGTGLLSISVTDAPVDGATAVVVVFSGIEFKPQGGPSFTIPISPIMEIDLLTQQGTDRATLLDEVEVPAGNYNWMRLQVIAESGVEDSYIEFGPTVRESLYIPSGEEHGLQLSSGFVVAAGTVTDFTIDFDLRKSVTDPQGQPDYFLRPSLRVINNLVVGSLTGTVSTASVEEDPACTNGPLHDMGNAVYVYEGPAATPDDVGGTGDQPITSAMVSFDEDAGEYVYTVGFLAEGTYTVAFTCQGMDDNPMADDTIEFKGTIDIDITAGNETIHDF
jgi:hypothetical protein